MNDQEKASDAERALIREMGLTPEDIERRKLYVGLGPDDPKRITRLKGIVQRNVEDLAETFFAFLSGREEAKALLDDRELVAAALVGLVDTHRARLLTEGLLKAIRERRAKGVVMDITGVPIVDSKVANHLAQACEAARLMGALVVLTGISSEIALTLVTIGAQLRGVRTVGDLQGGIELIERFLANGASVGTAADGEADARIGE